MDKLRSGILIQARMSSARLPGKVLMNIGCQPTLSLLVKRCKKVAQIDVVMIVTSDKDDDTPIANLANELGIDCFRGSLQDVLKRYIDAAEKQDIGHVVRACGDSPFILPELIEECFSQHINEGNDYTNAIDSDIVIDGIGVEIVTLDALKRSYNKSDLPDDREHVTHYIRHHQSEFKYGKLNSKRNYRVEGLNLLLDTKEDYDELLLFVARLPADKLLEDITLDDIIFTINNGKVV